MGMLEYHPCRRCLRYRVSAILEPHGYTFWVHAMLVEPAEEGNIGVRGWGSEGPPAPANFFQAYKRGFIAVLKIFPRYLGTGEPQCSTKTRFSEIFSLKIKMLRGALLRQK